MWLRIVDRTLSRALAPYCRRRPESHTGGTDTGSRAGAEGDTAEGDTAEGTLLRGHVLLRVSHTAEGDTDEGTLLRGTLLKGTCPAEGVTHS